MKLVLLILLFAIPVESAQKQLKEGNRQFKKGNYDNALKLYEDGLIDTPYSSILHFNAGDATMMKGEFSKSEVSFMEAAKSANPILRGASHYNRGNAYFYQGKWQEAIDAYKDSLRANPQDEDAKYNLAVAQKALKNPPPPKAGSQGSKSQNDSGKDKDKKPSDENAQAKQPKPGEMSKEDAERLLAAAGANEKKKGNQQAGQPGAGKNDEDW